MTWLLLVIALLLFVGLVVVHEYGHYKAAKKDGVVVEEFGIGFPPKVWGKKLKDGMLFSINLLPLGGFVKLKGEHDSDKTKGSFGAASLSTKVKIMVAGVFMNLVAAFGIFTILAVVGMPQLVENQFSVDQDSQVIRDDARILSVEEGSPAEAAGLESPDIVTAIGPSEHTLVPVAGESGLMELTESFAGEEVTVQVERDGETKNLTTTLRDQQTVEDSRDTDEPVGYLGVSPISYTLERSTWSAPIVAAGTIAQFTWLTLDGVGTALWSLITGDTATASEQVAGPVGIFAILRDGTLLGYEFILMIIGVISLTLAIMNILPIPALDGGKLFVMLLYRLLNRIGKKFFNKSVVLTKRAEEAIHGTGFLALIILIILITVVDVRRFF